MARTKNYAKLIEITEKKIEILSSKYQVLHDEMTKMQSEKTKLMKELDDLKLAQIKSLMSEKGLSVSDLENMINQNS